MTQQPNAPSRPADPARTAAQRAFFQAAMGVETPATAQPAQAARPVKAVQPASRFTAQPQAQAQIPDTPPQRILRPGSFIDIKV